MQFTIHKQKPTPRKTGITGELAVTLDGEAMLFDKDNRLICQMVKVELRFINPSGLLLRGFEPNGFDRQGRARYLYQEWLCNSQ